eukprot:SAG22_NODE_1883_length_3378_cov_3.332723_7_plen_133_part_00
MITAFKREDCCLTGALRQRVEERRRVPTLRAVAGRCGRGLQRQHPVVNRRVDVVDHAAPLQPGDEGQEDLALQGSGTARKGRETQGKAVITAFKCRAGQGRTVKISGRHPPATRRVFSSCKQPVEIPIAAAL